MNWWLDLSDQPLHAVQFVEGASRLVAVWFSPLSADVYDDGGAFLGTFDVDPPASFDPASEDWQQFINSLRIPPDDWYVNPVDANGVTVLMSYDGRLRIYWERPHRLVLESDGQAVELPRDDDAALVAVGLDRDLGTIAALSASKTLHFYQQHVYVGGYRMRGILPDGRVHVFLPDAAGVALVVHDSGALVVDLAGRVRAETTLTSGVDVAACAAEGQIVVMGERHSAMLNVYNADLTPLHQGSAFDLLEVAHPLQLMPRLPSEQAQLTSVVVADDGALAFMLDGVVCRSRISDLPELPRPRALF